MHISGSYIPAKWVEETYGEVIEGKKTTKVSAEFQFSGGIVGIGAVEYLMSYSEFSDEDMHASTAHYVGQITIAGLLGGKQGSFVLHDRGTFMLGAAKSTIEIVRGSGTGELVGIFGSGTYIADAEGCSWELNCELDTQ